MNSNYSYSPETLISGQNQWFFVPCDLEIWRMILKKNTTPLLCYFKLCASFRNHWWIQAGVTVRKHPIWVKVDDFFSRVTLKFHGWPWKIIGHLSLKCCFKLCASFQFHQWIQTGVTARRHLFRVKIDDFFVPCDLEIWQMTLKKNRARLRCYFKLFASFCNHWWIQTGVTVRKHPIWVKIDDVDNCVTLKFDEWPWKTTGHLFYATSSFVHCFVAIGEFKLELQSGNAQLGSNSSFWAPWPWNLTDDLAKP